MPEYTITDANGRSLTVTGDAPPTPADIDAIFAANPAPTPVVTTQPAASAPTGEPTVANLAMEGVAGAVRPFAALVDFAMTPVRAGRELITGKPTPPGLSGIVAQRGDFAGPGLGTDVLAATGELSTLGLTGGAVNRAIAQSFDDLMRVVTPSQEGFAVPRFFQALGASTPADDLVLSGLAGAGGELTAAGAQEVFGGGEGPARLAGQILTPAGALGLAQAARVQVNAFLKTAAPTTESLRGASRAYYSVLEEAGLEANGPSVSTLSKTVTDFVDSNNIALSTGTGPLAGRVRDLLKQAEDGRVTYGFLDRVRSDLLEMGKGTDDKAFLARELASKVDDFVINMQVANPAALNGGTVKGHVEAARELWRRYSLARKMDNIVADVGEKALSTGQDVVPNLRREFGKLLLSTNKDGRFLTKAEKDSIREVVRGGRIENMLRTASLIGFNSNDLVRTVLIQSAIGGGTFAATQNVVGSGQAILAATAVGEVAKRISNRMFQDNANFLRSVLRAGGNPDDVVNAYFRNTPRSQRNPAELTALFLENKVNLDGLRQGFKASPFVSDAVAMAVVGQRMLEEEQATKPATTP